MIRSNIIVITVYALALGSCAVIGPENEYEIPKISGCVVDAELTPLEGVRVELTFSDGRVLWQGETDKKGRFLFSGKKKFNLFRKLSIGDRVIFVTVRIYKKSVLAFSEVYEILLLARQNKTDKTLADLTKRDWTPEPMRDIGVNKPSCFVI